MRTKTTVNQIREELFTVCGGATHMETSIPSGGTAGLRRLFANSHRLYARVDNLPGMMDQLAQNLVDLLEEIDPKHGQADHLLGAAGLIARRQEGVFRPLSLKGRPAPEELRSFVEHVGPGDIERPTGMMGWSVARRRVPLRQGDKWFVASRDDSRDRWEPMRPATADEVAEMTQADIKAFPSLQSQIAVPILDPEMRGQARPRDAIGILNLESDELISPEFCDFLLGYSASIGYPLRVALRHQDLRRLSRGLAEPVSRASLARMLLDTNLYYLPHGRRHGLVALRDSRDDERFVVERMTTRDLPEEMLRAYRSGKLALTLGDGIWGEVIRTGRTQYLPDVSRSVREQHHPIWTETQCSLVIPLVSVEGGPVLGLLGLESGETSYAFSTQDQDFFKTTASLATAVAARIEETRLEFAEAVRVLALLKKHKKDQLADIPEDQFVRINAICRALVRSGFVFHKAAEEWRLTVHILREYTSRSPRIIDVDALRTLAARREGRHGMDTAAGWMD